MRRKCKLVKVVVPEIGDVQPIVEEEKPIAEVIPTPSVVEIPDVEQL